MEVRVLVMDQEGHKSKKSAKKKNLVFIILAVLLALSFVAVGYLFWQNQQLRNDPQTTQKAQENQANALKDKVGKLISVPNETPIVATVSDKEKLKDQPFFADAQNGDYILMFPQAKKAYIYREKENKLINVGPIAITSDTTQTPAGTTKKQQ